MRRTKEEAEQTKQHIISASIKVMNEKGLSSTRFEDIAKEANVTRGAIYHYFKNKNEIIYAIHLNAKKQMLEIFGRHISEDVDPVISLKSGLKEIINKFENDSHFRSIEELFLKAEFASVVKEDEELKQLFENEREETVCKMLELIKRGQEIGSIRKDIKGENVGHAIISLYVGFITTWFMQIRRLPHKDSADDFINILLHGILK